MWGAYVVEWNFRLLSMCLWCMLPQMSPWLHKTTRSGGTDLIILDKKIKFMMIAFSMSNCWYMSYIRLLLLSFVVSFLLWFVRDNWMYVGELLSCIFICQNTVIIKLEGNICSSICQTLVKLIQHTMLLIQQIGISFFIAEKLLYCFYLLVLSKSMHCSGYVCNRLFCVEKNWFFA